MLADLRAALPQGPWSGRYVEPFIGGGALFFDLDPERAWISDVNPELIHMYRMIVSDVDGVIACLRDMPNDQEFFLRIRRMSFPEAVQQGAAFAAADRAFRVADVIASGIESGIPKRSMVKMLYAMEALVG